MKETTSLLSHPKYRPDIDGLRAIAVLSVVAFHAFPNWIRGGFIGVDVFFVISGFLISTIIFKNLDSRTFSFAEFYSRRIRRIFPALLLVLIACSAFGWFALLADEYKQLGKHTAAGAGFISNFVLWNEAGYFDNSADTKPLLHLWSLGIEEQFYIIWPLALWFAWKQNFNLLTIIVIVAALSFLLNLKGVKQDMAAAFYSPLTRFWELLSGSMLAWVFIYKNDKFSSVYKKIEKTTSAIVYKKNTTDISTLPNIISAIGLSLLIYGFLQINKGLAFPGKWALLPVLGSMFIISAGSNAFVNRVILSNKLLVWFGLISFPLYLWHWPILSFVRIIESDTPSREIRIAAVILSIFLAWCTYKFIEKPMRHGKNNAYKTTIIMMLMLVIGGFGFYTYKMDGFKNRGSLVKASKNHELVSWIADDNPDTHNLCMKMYNLSDYVRYCNVSSSDKPSIAIIGDSHARALYDGMSNVMKEYGEGVLNIGGRLFLDVDDYPINNEFEFKVNKGGIRGTLLAANDSSIKTVVMVTRGPKYLTEDKNRIFKLVDRPELTDRKVILETAIRRTLDPFLKARKNVIYVIDNPEIDFDPRSCIDDRPMRVKGRSKSPCAIPKYEYDLKNKEYRELVLSIVRDYPNVKVFDASAYLCDDKLCWAKKDGDILYRDEHHLSEAGSLLLSHEIVKIIEPVKPKKVPN